MSSQPARQRCPASSVWIIREVYSVVRCLLAVAPCHSRRDILEENYLLLMVTWGITIINHENGEASVFALTDIVDWISTPGVDVALATCATLTSGAPSGFYPALISPHLQAGPRWLELIRRVFNWIVLPTPSYWALELSTGLRDISSARTARTVWLAMICPCGLAL